MPLRKHLMILSQILFKLTALSTTAFIITILAMVAMLVGDPDAPVNIWFNKHGASVMTIEVISIAVLGLAAMAADRNETLRQQQKTRKQSGQ